MDVATLGEAVRQAKAFAKSRFQPAARPTQSVADAGGPVLKRIGNGPVLTLATQNPAPDAATPTTAPSLYWLWVVDARAALGAAAVDEYYGFYSTDHNTTGGIYLVTGPTSVGPWTGRGRVYLDTASGQSTETPSVIWNDDEQLWFMYYQQATVAGAVGVQTTCLATSPTGLPGSWARVGPVIDIPSGGQVQGDGHTGYFKPFRVGGKWYAYHLYGGRDYCAFALSQSYDGRVWWTEHRALRYATDQVDSERAVNWNSCNVVEWRGRLWVIGTLGSFASGTATRDDRIFVAPLASNLRHIDGKARVQLYPTIGTETTNYKSLHAFVDREGSLVLLYQSDNNIYAAKATA